MNRYVDRFLLGILVLGLLISAGSLFRGILGSNQVQVEYLNGSDEKEIMTGEIFVDIEGAVVRPGVYQLAENERFKDALIKAGGFSEKADRGYCEKNLNMAQLLKDGQKIYIPFVGDTPSIPGYNEAKTTGGVVNVNSASLSELDTLEGVGTVRVNSIVKNRPYTTIEELVSKGGLTKQILEKNEGRIVLY